MVVRGRGRETVGRRLHVSLLLTIAQAGTLHEPQRSSHGVLHFNKLYKTTLKTNTSLCGRPEMKTWCVVALICVLFIHIIMPCVVYIFSLLKYPGRNEVIETLYRLDILLIYACHSVKCLLISYAKYWKAYFLVSKVSSSFA